LIHLQGVPSIRFSADLADPLLIHDANAVAVTAENPKAEIGIFLFLRKRGFRDGRRQFIATMMAINTLVQYNGTTGRAISPPKYLVTVRTFHEKFLLPWQWCFRVFLYHILADSSILRSAVCNHPKKSHTAKESDAD
jgi:hypothetical protein